MGSMKRKITMVMVSITMLAALLAPMAVTAAATDVPWISAPAAIVLDYETSEVLWARGEHDLRVPASMTKLVSAFVIYEEIAAGNLALDTMVRVSRNAYRISVDANMQGSTLPMREGVYRSVDDMLHLMMLPSSNGACVAMADHISGSEAAFAYRMNAVAQRVGGRAYFNNAHGALPHYTTAYTMAKIVREFIYEAPDILRITSAASMNDAGTTRSNTNLLVRSGSDFFYRYADGFRTGTTTEAGFCLASTAYRDGRRVIVIVMGARNNNERYGDSIALLEWGLQESARRYAERYAEMQRELAERITLVADGEEVTLQAPARMVNDRVMTSKDIFTVLGADAEWDEANQTITAATEDGDTIIFTIGSYFVLVGEQVVELDVAPEMVNDLPHIPTRAVAEAMGRTVQWDGETRTVYVK